MKMPSIEKAYAENFRLMKDVYTKFQQDQQKRKEEGKPPKPRSPAKIKVFTRAQEQPRTFSQIGMRERFHGGQAVQYFEQQFEPFPGGGHSLNAELDSSDLRDKKQLFVKSGNQFSRRQESFVDLADIEQRARSIENNSRGKDKHGNRP